VHLSGSFYYLLGLVTGKGSIFDELVTIEFPHKNEFIDGIGYCPLCNYLATKPSGAEKLKCKNLNCQNSESPSINSDVKKRYHQPSLVNSSINDVIIPFLKQNIEFEFKLLTNTNCSILTLSNLDKDIFEKINELLNHKRNFYQFEIDQRLNDLERNLKIEFINGLMDVCGTPNAGGWINRDGINGHGRMRSYFQIDQKNWKLAVQIDNFLRRNFNIPTQKFDWGHPNIRDSNLKDYYNSGVTSAFREHQVGFYPEYFQIFEHRISPKKELFQELLAHNLNCGFDEEDDWLKSKLEIGQSKIKPFHPMEVSNRLPIEIRKHFNAQWQINLALGCENLNEIRNNAYDAEIFGLTGIQDQTDKSYDEFEREFNDASENKTDRNRIRETDVNQRNSRNTPREIDTYPILTNWLKNKLDQEYGSEQNLVFDTSVINLNQVIQSSSIDNSVISKIDEIDSLNIRPDVVGYLKNLNDFIFIESKIVSLGIKELGQILGYCKVANPKEAYLVTTKEVSRTILQLISIMPDLFTYGENKKIKIGRLKENNVVIDYE
tara:strand:- start:3168 stop:4811 length:1644 start_codon:yes stop_codon:yes gene_type:complete